MGVWGWLLEHWFDLLSAVGIIGGLAFTAASFHSEAKTRRVANLIKLTTNHRELLKEFYSGVNLSRILDKSVDLRANPVSRGEEVYVTELILHVSAVFRAMKTDLTMKPDGIRQDIREFFGLPIPQSIWNKVKPFQDHDLVQFVEDCLKEPMRLGASKRS